jgi:hypothetical protein
VAPCRKAIEFWIRQRRRTPNKKSNFSKACFFLSIFWLKENRRLKGLRATVQILSVCNYALWPTRCLVPSCCWILIKIGRLIGTLDSTKHSAIQSGLRIRFKHARNSNFAWKIGIDCQMSKSQIREQKSIIFMGIFS